MYTTNLCNVSQTPNNNGIMLCISVVPKLCRWSMVEGPSLRGRPGPCLKTKISVRSWTVHSVCWFITYGSFYWCSSYRRAPWPNICPKTGITGQNVWDPPVYWILAFRYLVYIIFGRKQYTLSSDFIVVFMQMFNLFKPNITVYVSMLWHFYDIILCIPNKLVLYHYLWCLNDPIFWYT